jgi:hypothetical protein
VSEAESPDRHVGDYGVRLSGFVLPPVSGEYQFYICSDDEGQVLLSSDADPANKRAIAREPEWNAPRIWTGGFRRPNSENISKPIFLSKGQRYYIEVLMKQGGQDEHVAVAWRLPGGPPPADGALPISGAFLACENPSEQVSAKNVSIQYGAGQR